VSTNRGTPIALDAKSRTGQAFRDIARRVMGEQVPLSSPNGSGGFITRLSKLLRAGGD